MPAELWENFYALKTSGNDRVSCERRLRVPSIGLMSTRRVSSYELAAISRQIMVWKLIQLRFDRCASLDEILSVLRDTESA